LNPVQTERCRRRKQEQTTSSSEAQREPAPHEPEV
jgi:hypothetical protein